MHSLCIVGKHFVCMYYESTCKFAFKSLQFSQLTSCIYHRVIFLTHSLHFISWLKVPSNSGIAGTKCIAHPQCCITALLSLIIDIMGYVWASHPVLLYFRAATPGRESSSDSTLVEMVTPGKLTRKPKICTKIILFTCISSFTMGNTLQYCTCAILQHSWCKNNHVLSTS